MQQETGSGVEVARKMQERLRQLAGHVRNDIDATEDEALSAALETSLQVIEGLGKTFERHAREYPGAREDPGNWEQA